MPDGTNDPYFRRRKKPLILLAIYLPLLIVPWIATCILATRPFHAKSYLDQAGISPEDVALLGRWLPVINVLSTIASLLTVPILSALVAQAAVIFSQRRSENQTFSVRHLIALADRSWIHFPTLWSSVGWREPGSAAARLFLYLAAGLITISVLQQPLYQILVPFESITIPTCYDTSYIHVDGYGTGPCPYPGLDTNPRRSLGYDIEPVEMAAIPETYMTQRLVSQLPLVSLTATQPRLWMEDPSKNRLQTFMNGWPQSLNRAQNKNPSRMFTEDWTFVAGFTFNTTTGVLREHVMRLNSSVECNRVEPSQFPTNCIGASPFTFDSSFRSNKSAGLKVCVPGESGRSPWTLSRSRQDIDEEMFLSIEYMDDSLHDQNSTVHCKVSTTRGYFELGNLRSNNQYGPLIESWPSADEMRDEFNDYLQLPGGTGIIPSEEDNTVALFHPELQEPTQGLNTSGPLMASALALFGKDSWSSIVSKLTDTTDPTLASTLCRMTPFLDYLNTTTSCTDTPPLPQLLHNWTSAFNDTDSLERKLFASAFLANQAVLTTFDQEYPVKGLGGGRQIYTSPGTLILKPVVSRAEMVVISVLILAQVAGLVFVVLFIYRVPSWTHALDGMAMARVGASLGTAILPSLSPVGQGEGGRLKAVDGCVGVGEGAGGRGGQPVLGAPGVVRKRAVSLDLELAKLVGGRADMS